MVQLIVLFVVLTIGISFLAYKLQKSENEIRLLQQENIKLIDCCDKYKRALSDLKKSIRTEINLN